MSCKPRWTQGCVDSLKLEKYFLEGKIPKDATATSIYNNPAFSEFKKYSKAVFTTNYNSIRSLLGIDRKYIVLVIVCFSACRLIILQF